LRADDASNAAAAAKTRRAWILSPCQPCGLRCSHHGLQPQLHSGLARGRFDRSARSHDVVAAAAVRARVRLDRKKRVAVRTGHGEAPDGGRVKEVKLAIRLWSGVAVLSTAVTCTVVVGAVVLVVAVVVAVTPIPAAAAIAPARRRVVIVFMRAGPRFDRVVALRARVERPTRGAPDREGELEADRERARRAVDAVAQRVQAGRLVQRAVGRLPVDRVVLVQLLARRHGAGGKRAGAGSELCSWTKLCECFRVL